MSVVSVKPLHTNRPGRASSSEKEYTAHYLVETDNVANGAKEVIDGCGLTLGQGYTFGTDSDASVELKELAPTDVAGSRFHWLLRANWKTPGQIEEKEDPDGNATDNPLAARAEWDFGATQVQTAVQQAILRTAIPDREVGDLLPMMNSAGQELDPAPTMDESLQTIRVSYNRAQFPSNANAMVNAVNSDLVSLIRPEYNLAQVYLPYQLRVISIGGSFRLENRVKFWRMTNEIHAKRFAPGWRHQELDRGTHVLCRAGDPNGKGGIVSASDIDPGWSFKRVLQDLWGNPITEPTLLNGLGQPLEPGAEPVFILWSVYTNEIPFAGIDFLFPPVL